MKKFKGDCALHTHMLISFSLLQIILPYLLKTNSTWQPLNTVLLNWEWPLIKVWNLLQSVRLKSHYGEIACEFYFILNSTVNKHFFNFLNYKENNLAYSSTQHLKQMLPFCCIWFKSFCCYCGRNKIFRIQGKAPPPNSFPLLPHFPQR